ncbi:uncharacterized protein LOC143921750 isoform X2 [Arctopsyche grandis]
MKRTSFISIFLALIICSDSLKTVRPPIRCPKGQKLAPDGTCSHETEVKDLPLSCPEGKILGSDGLCSITRRIIDAPVQCEDGDKPDSMGMCRSVWRKLPGEPETTTQAKITTTQCPPKHRRNLKGKCVKSVVLTFLANAKSKN